MVRWLVQLKRLANYLITWINWTLKAQNVNKLLSYLSRKTFKIFLASVCYPSICIFVCLSVSWFAQTFMYTCIELSLWTNIHPHLWQIFLALSLAFVGKCFFFLYLVQKVVSKPAAYLTHPLQKLKCVPAIEVLLLKLHRKWENTLLPVWQP